MATELGNFGVDIDGMLGLGWPALAVGGATPFMFNAKDCLDSPVFSIYLTMTTYACLKTASKIRK